MFPVLLQLRHLLFNWRLLQAPATGIRMESRSYFKHPFTALGLFPHFQLNHRMAYRQIWSQTTPFWGGNPYRAVYYSPQSCSRADTILNPLRPCFHGCRHNLGSTHISCSALVRKKAGVGFGTYIQRGWCGICPFPIKQPPYIPF